MLVHRGLVGDGLEPLLDVAEEARRLQAIHDAMVEGEREEHHPPTSFTGVRQRPPLSEISAFQVQGSSCEFTTVHPSRGQIRGQLIGKGGFADP